LQQDFSLKFDNSKKQSLIRYQYFVHEVYVRLTSLQFEEENDGSVSLPHAMLFRNSSSRGNMDVQYVLS